jgi:hypothetical protein
MLLLLSSLALAGTWDNVSTDIHARGRVTASPEAVTTLVSDLARMKALVPADCVGRWEPGLRTSGEGATSEVRYDIGLMHRTLPLVVSKVVPGRYVDWDHPGKKGFVTRWALTPDGDGTFLDMTSYFAGPGWPLRRYYHGVMKPEWEGCQARTVAAIAASFGSAPVTRPNDASPDPDRTVPPTP